MGYVDRKEVCVILDHILNGCKHLPHNYDDRLLAAAALFQRLILLIEIRSFFVLLTAARAHSTSRV